MKNISLFVLSYTATSRKLVYQVPLVRRTYDPFTYLKEVILQDRSHSDICSFGQVILKPCGFSDILFASKLP